MNTKKIEIYGYEMKKINPEETRQINGFTVKVIPLVVNLPVDEKTYIKLDKALVVPLDERNKFLLDWYKKTKALVKSTKRGKQMDMIHFSAISNTEKKRYSCFPLYGFYIKNDYLIFIRTVKESPTAEKKIKSFFKYFPKVELVKK